MYKLMVLFLLLHRCVLAAIILVNLRGALRKFAEIPSMWRNNRIDALVWIITMLTSSLINTELGLLVGVLVSVFCVLGRTQRVQVQELGRTKTHEHYEALLCYRGLHRIPGVAIFRYEAPIYYANQSIFKKSLYSCVGLDPVKENTQRLKFEIKESKQQKDIKDGPNMKSERIDLDEYRAVSLRPDLKQGPGVCNIVIDCSTILFVDTAGVNALKEVRKDYSKLGIQVVLAQCNTTVLDALEKGGYFPEKKDRDGVENNIVFYTISDAVSYVQSLPATNGDCDAKCRKDDSSV